MIPTRPLSRAWGSLMSLHLPVWSRAPLLGLYSRIFQCNLAESDRRDYHEYESFSDLFTRHLKEGAREFDENHELVSIILAAIIIGWSCTLKALCCCTHVQVYTHYCVILCTERIEIYTQE